ncbi:D-threo-aldose 1-dehydrogenase [Kribbella steppae]|uniref:D-threo-aldose 1-dehydrogenase n=1 Tax=Kribbella steppae TaxID=2512223 RepID=A0A4V2RYE1_9ACTN|nr:aldo/keto reductase [Kribbella steppae]TCO19707.1 D-threo-aldose 1-dehydrogenase [Kribbella steppae]
MSESRVGRTDLFVPQVGLGTAALGNFQQAISDAAAVAVVDRAIERGVGYLDTAPLYGHGLAESRVGQAVAKVSRDGLVISTKVGRLLREDAPRDETQYHDGVPFYRDVPTTGPVWDFTYDGIRRSVEESLERTGLDRFDVLLLHDPDKHLADAASTGYTALHDLRAAGLVQAIGAGMNNSAPLTELVRSCELDVVLLAGRYTLLDQSSLTDLLPACEEREVSVVIGGVFNSGVLVDPAPGASFDYIPAGDAVLAKAVAIRDVCRKYDVPLAAAALRFPVAHPRVCTVLVGARTVDELDVDLGLFDVDIPAGLWADLRHAGLLDPDVPTPE